MKEDVMLQIKQKMLLGSIVFFVALLCLTPICFAGVDAAPYLRLGAGAAAIGVGGAVTAVVDDATSTVWNPAGLGSVRDVTFTVSTVKQVFDSRQSFLGLATDVGEKGALGLSIMSLTVDDLTRYDDAGIARQSFRYNSNAVSVSYGHAFSKFNLGAGFGILTDSFSLDSVDSENGFRGFDLGFIGYGVYATIRGEEIPTVSYGLALRNLGGSIADSNVPVLFDAGLAFKLIRKSTATFSVDVEHEFIDLEEASTSVRLGAEYLIRRTFAIRGGARGTRDHQSLFAGFGVDVGGLRVDYALQDEPSSRLSEVGTTHYVSLSYSY
jgi:hypothetical protein